MGSRGHESGMDFEYENKTGPMDPMSPFARVAQRNAGPYSAFDSPNKNSSSSPSKNNSSLAAFNSLYTTPRKPQPDVNIDDSSAGETPRSPDSDATPEMRRAGRALTNLNFNHNNVPATAPPAAARERGSPSKEQHRGGVDRPSPPPRRESWLVKSMKKAFSPGRGELARPQASHAGAVEKQVKRRREKGIQRQMAQRRQRRHSMSGDYSGEDENSELIASQTSPRKASGRGQKTGGDDNASGGPKQHWISATFTFIAQHPTVPHILSFYAQLAFNIFLLVGCAYLIWCFWAAVQGDVDKKAHEAMAEIMAEMAVCARSFRENRCEPLEKRLPALETVCNNWAKCMNQDPTKVGRAKVSAHTFAEIFNEFVEPISWKAMIFTFALVFGCFLTTNMAFGIFRQKTTAGDPQYHHQPYYPPPTPQRSFSGQDAAGYYAGGGGGTPWHQPPVHLLEPQPSPSKYAQQQQLEGRGGSPVRLLKYS